jgi:hypothetical protein
MIGNRCGPKLARDRSRWRLPAEGEPYEENEDPIGTTDLATFVLGFFAAFFSAFLSAFFAIFRNLLCLTTIRASV